MELGQDFSRALGRHALRTGVLYEGAFVRSDERRNAEGTYTFASQADWEAGRPALFTQRTGDPRVAVDLHRIGLYAQDDWRPTDALAINGGVALRSPVVRGRDRANFSPRLGVTWAVRPTWTVRAGAGRIFDWLEADPVVQVRSGDGTHTRDISIEAPGLAGRTRVRHGRRRDERRWALGANLVRRHTRLSLGLEHSFGPVRLNTEYAYERGASLLRARNLAQDGGRLFEVRAEGRSRAHTVRTDAMIGAPGRRAGGMVGYMFRTSRNDTDGPLALPADDANLAAEWGPAADDARHRVFGFGHWRILDACVSPARSSPSPARPGMRSPAATTTATP